ncbi:hypothetical protein [Flindersiella endophytica]
MSQVEEIADELYALVPREFTAARDERVRAARAEGDRALATALGKLRRPSQSAWLVNLLSRRERERVEELLELAEDFRSAHQHADAAQLRELSTRRQRLMSALIRDARRLAAEVEVNPNADAVREVESTLEAGLADPAIAERIREARLTEPASYSGFELGITPMFPAPATAAPDGGGAEDARKRALEQAREALATEEEATTTATRDRDDLTVQVEQARHELDRLERKLSKSERELEQQQRRLDRARAEYERVQQEG